LPDDFLGDVHAPFHGEVDTGNEAGMNNNGRTMMNQQITKTTLSDSRIQAPVFAGVFEY
jgi:hypothetical protein